MVHLRNFITHEDQECRKLGVGHHDGFYQLGYRDGLKLCLQILCLGKNWDPQTRSYEEFRSIDGANLLLSERYLKNWSVITRKLKWNCFRQSGNMNSLQPTMLARLMN
ncbi:hypothetical protein AQUCO_06700046v1 [Aquilegia coerulea]|uniref:Uncharacterized protein n=1 Tax=Aquilegia coerulea TaxID=218851 RepID=A0A2G5CBX2_AQUCA|nr:hypothetical protein AQUCO_06700046v1 [Aquilegia coerulea]